MLNIGLTGSIACGKSTVALLLQEKGAFHIDFDLLAHEVEEPDQPAWQGIVDTFGTEILREDHTLDRARLGQIVFSDRRKLDKLNEIVHPAVFLAWQRRIEEIRAIRPDAVILSDIPLLIELGMQKRVDLVMLVYIPREEQIRRLMLRNGYSLDEAVQRVNSQMPIEDKLDFADIIVNNSGTREQTRAYIEKIWPRLLERERQKKESA
ncbi:dephospho-CoA kinase [Syntrophus gentianae]|uniref:Dephospho-CoA kinase n=1 Tax=Syntrophus gentianae TaxID=43775 RepID=A0A1H7WP03_9BACT|nr:dephospho-CoA kinase [Syntrophus gentianae]SEM23213.1 dephospho-CoA kinase [Syntrophus gentianae]